MKFFIVFATLVAAASAVPYAGLVNTGASAVSRSDDVSFFLCSNSDFYCVQCLV